MKNKIKIPPYNLTEKLINSISHGLGACLGITGLILLIIKAKNKEEYLCVLAFGISIIVLYTISTIYHALSSKIKAKRVFRLLDHISVNLLVLGTYTPVILLGITESVKWTMLVSISLLTILGIILTLINIDKYKIISVLIHLVNGWSIILVLDKLLINIGPKGLLFIIIGGIIYTIGALLYAIGSKIKYMHSVFHFFTLAGTIFHFFAIYIYII